MNTKDQNVETKKEKEATEESKVCYSCGSTQSTITFLLFGLNTVLCFQNNANNSSMKFVIILPPK